MMAYISFFRQYATTYQFQVQPDFSQAGEDDAPPASEAAVTPDHAQLPENPPIVSSISNDNAFERLEPNLQFSAPSATPSDFTIEVLDPPPSLSGSNTEVCSHIGCHDTTMPICSHSCFSSCKLHHQTHKVLLSPSLTSC